MRIRFHAGWIAFAVLGAGCATLPSLEGRPIESTLVDTADTPLAVASEALAGAHPGKTGIHALTLPTDAFAARALLAMAARRSLDAQYYIWHGDETGMLLFDALRQAARRGVRVRLLLDDQGTSGLDGMLAALQAEANFEIRLYNPFANRGLRSLGYLGGFARLNRRMHNKVFIADAHVVVVGGRNVGNEYFGAGSEVPFRDLDVVAIGAAVAEASAEFDLYWNSASAYSVASLLSAASAQDLKEADDAIAAARASDVSKVYVEAVRETPLVRRLLERSLPMEWADARLVRDDPAKTLAAEPRPEDLALTEMIELAGPAERSLDLISPYFVPAEKGTEALTWLARRGVAVRILTNSLSSTDVSVVHSGYAKRRCELARAGVKLFELKPTAIESLASSKHRSPAASSSASLHAKTFAVDRSRIFVGSFNFDPRSALLNTEMGLIIESPVLAGRLAESLDKHLPELAYEVKPIAGDACIVWIEHTATGDVEHDTEPGVSSLRRAWLGILMALPLDWML